MLCMYATVRIQLAMPQVNVISMRLQRQEATYVWSEKGRGLRCKVTTVPQSEIKWNDLKWPWPFLGGHLVCLWQ